jgi:putative tryptophan/tyrosine transport system substrate-binding protein
MPFVRPFPSDIVKRQSGGAIFYKHAAVPVSCAIFRLEVPEASDLNRREFITLLGGAVAWPLVARAQQPDQVPAIGILIGYADDHPKTQARLAAFRQALGELGWIEGRNVRIDYRFAPAGADQAQLFAKELVALRPNVLIGNSTTASVALSRETRKIPIVFVGVPDPVGGGLVASSGNATGFTNFEPSITGKWLELLKEIAPGIVRVAVIFNPKSGGRFLLGPFEAVARSFAVEPIAVPVNDAAHIESALASVWREPGGGLMVTPDAFTLLLPRAIIALATQHHFPAIYPYPNEVVEGGLMSYGVDTVDLFRRAASYVDRPLKGERASDLAVQAPVKFNLVLNLKTARALDLEVPSTLLARADKVIE